MNSSLLGRLPLFTEVSSDSLARLEHRMRRREFAPRSVIVREGTADDSAFIVLSGRVAVRRRDPDTGIDFLLAELGEGQMFGEMALLTRKPRTASVVALDATTCGILDQSNFDQLLAEQPSAARAMMAALAERLDAANRHIGVDFVNLSRVKVDPRVLRLLPQAIVHEHKVVPISFANSRLTLAMTNPGAPGAPAAGAKPAAPAGVDLLESDLIRELQLAADTDEPKAETKQDLMSASEGETRDKETAHTAVEAALTGHLVFSTLHTNNAAAAFTRLQEMDVEPFLVSSSTIGVIAQRLARRLCQECRESYPADGNIADVKRYSAWLLAEGLMTVDEVTSVVSVDI